MPFDLSTAKPVGTSSGGFDLSSAKPVVAQPSAADIAMADPTNGMGTIARAVAGYGSALPTMLQGVGQHIGQILGPTATAALHLPTQADVDETSRLNAPLRATTAGKVGSVLGTVAASVPAAYIPGAGSAVGAAAVGAGLGAIAPTATGDSSRVEIPFTHIGADVGSPVLANALMGAGLGAAGVGAGKAVGMTANKLLSASAADTAANAGKLGAIQSARDAGYVLPPTDINPSPINSLAEGLSGKIKTQQAASFKNQPVTNSLAAKALGLPENTVITPEVLGNIRKTAGQAYEAVRGAGDVTASAPFQQALDTIGGKYQGASASFPGLVRSDVPDMISALKQPVFNASDAVDAISVLRGKSDQAFKTGDTDLGKAAKDSADALESELGRHMTDTGQDPAMIDAFRNARKQIAQTYSVQGALNPANGDVSAKLLAKQLAKGKPLSGDLKTIAQSASAFPESMQALTRDPGAVSPLDYLAAIANSKNSLMTGVNTLAVRPLMRNALLSKAGQSLATPSATPNALLQALSTNSTPGALIGQARRSTSATLNHDNRNP